MWPKCCMSLFQVNVSLSIPCTICFNISVTKFYVKYLFVTWKSIFVFHKLLSCSRQNESYEVYDRQIENYLNRWIITSLVAKDLVFWDLKVKPESCDTICFFSKMTWKEKNDLQERRKKTHDKSKISNLDQAKLFKYDLTKHSIKWIEAWSSIDSIIIIWVVTILRSLKVFQLWSFFHENFPIKHFSSLGGERCWADYFLVLFGIGNQTNGNYSSMITTLFLCVLLYPIL